MESKKDKKRLDIILVERGIVATREKAQALILSGNVLVEDVPADKVGVKYADGVNIRVRGEASRFVGRGGDKIDPAFDFFNIDLNGVVALDVGASTGGFTDCMLQRGAKLVYATDVGYNQLDHKLRSDDRVVVYEKTHAKNLEQIEFNPRPQFATIDVSFTGVRKVLGFVADALVADGAKILALIKPQFELGPEYVDKGGVVKSKENQLLAVRLVREHAEQLGWVTAKDAFPCPLRGEKSGNQEYFLLLTKK